MSKKLTGRALAELEANRDIWQEVLDGVREIKGRWRQALAAIPSAGADKGTR